MAAACAVPRSGEGAAVRRIVHHFGPDPAYAGGMGSVIRVLGEHDVGGRSVESRPTWRPRSRLASVPLALRAALAIPSIGRDEIVHVHLAENGAFVREGAIVAFARLLGRVTVVTIHGADFLAFASAHRRLAGSVLRRAHLVTCLDAGVLEAVRSLAPRSGVELLANPVAMDDRSPPADATEELVLFAGEIGTRKGADVLCDAWRLVSESHPNARCIMVGPVRDFAVPALERLEVRRPVGAQAMAELVRRARVVALPSRSEGMPMILTEAMAAGRPFVSTAVGAIPALAGEGGGTLVPVGDHVELARCLGAFLGDSALAAAAGERGRRWCRQTRSVEVIDVRLGELYADAARAAAR